MASTASSTTSSSGFFNLRSNNVESRAVQPSSSSTHGGSTAGGFGKLDGVAMWFINGVTTAFFVSLERCSCIRIVTEDDVGDEGNVVPLIHSDGNLRHEAGTTSRRRAGKGKKGGGGGGAFLQH